MKTKKFKLPDIGNLDTDRIRRVRKVARQLFKTEEVMVESEVHEGAESILSMPRSNNKGEEFMNDESSAVNSQ